MIALQHPVLVPSTIGSRCNGIVHDAKQPLTDIFV